MDLRNTDSVPTACLKGHTVQRERQTIQGEIGITGKKRHKTNVQLKINIDALGTAFFDRFIIQVTQPRRWENSSLSKWSWLEIWMMNRNKPGKMAWGWGRWNEGCFRSRKHLPESVLERWEYCGPFKWGYCMGDKERGWESMKYFCG